MKRKIVGIFVCMLLIATTVLPLVSSADKNDSSQDSNEVYGDDCGCEIGFLKENPQDPNYIPPKSTIKGLPDFFNWKDFGGQDWTTSAKDQADPQWCASCWTFAPNGILESVINIKEGSAVIDPDLSEQYILSCLPNATYPNPPGTGCNGGDTILALQYMMETTENGNGYNGALLEECFPYQADDDVPCDDKCPDWVDKLVPIQDCFEWWSNGNPEDIKLIKSQILEKGPVLVGILYTTAYINWAQTHHDPDDYFPYQAATSANHGVIIVGWKNDPSINKGGYWICKESFGTEWGYDGFVNIEYGSIKIDSNWVDWVEYDPNSYEWPNEPDPPDAPMMSGNTSGNVGTEYEYTFNSEDPGSNDVKYFISWGDGNTKWTDYSASGEDVTVKHTWDEEGTFTVMALAMNTDNSISPWETLDITMPRNRAINTPFLQFLQQYPILYQLLLRFLRL